MEDFTNRFTHKWRSATIVGRNRQWNVQQCLYLRYIIVFIPTNKFHERQVTKHTKTILLQQKCPLKTIIHLNAMSKILVRIINNSYRKKKYSHSLNNSDGNIKLATLLPCLCGKVIFAFQQYKNWARVDILSKQKKTLGANTEHENTDYWSKITLFFITW